MQMKIRHRESMGRTLVSGKDLGDVASLGLHFSGESPMVEVEQREGP